jgi:hypothetical protein
MTSNWNVLKRTQERKFAKKYPESVLLNTGFATKTTNVAVPCLASVRTMRRDAKILVLGTPNVCPRAKSAASVSLAAVAPNACSIQMEATHAWSFQCAGASLGVIATTIRECQDVAMAWRVSRTRTASCAHRFPSALRSGRAVSTLPVATMVTSLSSAPHSNTPNTTLSGRCAAPSATRATLTEEETKTPMTAKTISRKAKITTLMVVLKATATKSVLPYGKTAGLDRAVMD